MVLPEAGDGVGVKSGVGAHGWYPFDKGLCCCISMAAL